jgi:hypothetical protein
LQLLGGAAIIAASEPVPQPSDLALVSLAFFALTLVRQVNTVSLLNRSQGGSTSHPKSIHELLARRRCAINQLSS